MITDRTPLVKRLRGNVRGRGNECTSEKDPVEVFCRMRPLENADIEPCVFQLDSKTIKLCPPENSIAFRNGTAKEQHYKFQNVFTSDTSLKEVFDCVAKPLVEGLLAGKNGLLFAYGVTGSGKTYTMQGDPHDGGVLIRTLDVIYNSIMEQHARKYVFKPDCMNGFDVQTEADAICDQEKYDMLCKTPKTPRYRKDILQDSNSQRIPDTSHVSTFDEGNACSVFITFIEIYNKYIYDLLEEIPETNMTRCLQTKIIREDAQHNMYVHDCTEVEAFTVQEALEVLYRGQKRRKVAHTRLNCESSRSHSIFTIRVVQAPLDANGEVVSDKNAVTVSQLSLVDLAGSERTVRTRATGNRLKEAGNINNSLMTLRSCIEILRENQSTGSYKMVPYRDSKLTHYFKNFFDGEGIVKMVVCINPASDEFDETLPVMKFAELAAEVVIQRPVARPVQQDLALPLSGKRKANAAPRRQARKKLHLDDDSSKETTTDSSTIYSLGPPWPSCAFTPETIAEVTAKLMTHLEQRIESRKKLWLDFDSKISSFTQELMEAEKDYMRLKQENASVHSLYSDSSRKVLLLETKLGNAELANADLLKTMAAYEDIVEECITAKEERDAARTQSCLDKQRQKTRLKAKLEAEKERLWEENNKRSKELENQLNSRMYATHMKAVQDMFEGKCDQKSPFVHSSSDTDLPRVLTSNAVPSVLDPKLPTVQTGLEGCAVSNPRHRRSLSQGAQIWVDHRPGQIVEPNTVFQPNIPRRRSVRHLCSGDLFGENSTHYCLTTQNQDSAGELETKLFKGDVLPTVGGGAQVVFHDVEVLKQQDPLAVVHPSRKRLLFDGASEIDYQTVQDRCRKGIVNYALRVPSRKGKN